MISVFGYFGKIRDNEIQRRIAAPFGGASDAKSLHLTSV